MVLDNNPVTDHVLVWTGPPVLSHKLQLLLSAFLNQLPVFDEPLHDVGEVGAACIVLAVIVDCKDNLV